MKIDRIENMKGGWFIGNFEPSVFKNPFFEVGYKVHEKGELWDHHYHEHLTEYNLLISGSMKICGKELTAGDIFTIEPNEVADPVFHTRCMIITVKTPSVPGDKIIVPRLDNNTL